VVFKLSKQQLAERKFLAADLRKRAAALNTAIVAFNAAVEPLSQAVGEAQADYNGILEKARTLASSVTDVAQQKFDAKSEKMAGKRPRHPGAMLDRAMGDGIWTTLTSTWPSR
jgi:hypothetical protein